MHHVVSPDILPTLNTQETPPQGRAQHLSIDCGSWGRCSGPPSLGCHPRPPHLCSTHYLVSIYFSLFFPLGRSLIKFLYPLWCIMTLISSSSLLFFPRFSLLLFSHLLISFLLPLLYPHKLVFTPSSAASRHSLPKWLF